MVFLAGRKKPYCNAKGESFEEDRVVSAQPLNFGDHGYNVRALNNLPHHRTHANQLDLLNQQCLLNISFAITKLQALPIE